MGMDKTARQVEVRMVNVSPQDRRQTSHIIKAHTDSTRFNKKIICGNLWWFVGGKNLCNKMFV